jgi:hypothetical protein
MPDPHAWNDWTIDSFNVGVLGMNQTGKTTSMKELHAETPRVSIWLNAAGDDRVEGVAGKVCRSLGDVQRAFAADEWTIEWVASDRARAIQQLRTWLWDVAEKADRQLPVQVVVDEIHEIAAQSGEKHDPPRDACRKFGKQGVKRNIKFIGITQDPVAVDKQWLRQCEYRVVFRMSAEQQDAVSKFGFDFDAISATDRHTGAVHGADGTVLEDQVKAKAQYA